MRSMGESPAHGRLYLHNMYGQTNTSHANSSAHWCNLMGDPTVKPSLAYPKAWSYQPRTPSPRDPFLWTSRFPIIFDPRGRVSVTIYNDGYGDVVAKVSRTKAEWLPSWCPIS